MANIAISALPAASALSGVDLLAVVQSGSTKKATADQVFQYIIDAAWGGEQSIALGVTFAMKDGFGKIYCTGGFQAGDDGHGTGGYLVTAHQAIIGGYCTVGQYLNVTGDLGVAGHGQVFESFVIDGTTSTASMTFQTLFGLIEFQGTTGGSSLLRPNSVAGNGLEFVNDMRFNDGIAFGTYTASTGAITGSIAIKDKTGTTVHLMAFL
jgi:hypothetical protein